MSVPADEPQCVLLPASDALCQRLNCAVAHLTLYIPRATLRNKRCERSTAATMQGISSLSGPHCIIPPIIHAGARCHPKSCFVRHYRRNRASSLLAFQLAFQRVSVRAVAGSPPFALSNAPCHAIHTERQGVHACCHPAQQSILQISSWRALQPGLPCLKIAQTDTLAGGL